MNNSDLSEFLPHNMTSVIEDLNKDASNLWVTTEKRKFGKEVTMVKRFSKGTDLKKLAKTLKSKCATGGTIKNAVIELQGNQLKRVRDILTKEGFNLREP